MSMSWILSLPLASLISVAMNIGVHVSFGVVVLSRYMLRSETAGS